MTRPTLVIDNADDENWSTGDVDLLWDEILEGVDEIEKARGTARVRAYMRGGVMVRQSQRGYEAAGPKAPKAPKAVAAKPAMKVATASPPGQSARAKAAIPAPPLSAGKGQDKAWLTAFKAKSLRERDAEADATKSIKARIEATCGKRDDKRYSDEPVRAIEQRLKELSHLTSDKALMQAQQGLQEMATTALQIKGVDKAAVKALVLDTTDTLMAQEHEALGRSLGDHGVRHLLTDAHVGIDIMSKAGDKSPETQVMMLFAGMNHDAGYLTGPSRKWADGDHPHWSMQHYNANTRDKLAAVIGKDNAREMSTIIATHAMTHMDWQGAPRAAAFRLADNLGLFHADKLPGFVHEVPGNTDALVRLGKGEIDLPTAKGIIKSNIDSAKLKPNVKAQFLRAAEEVNPMSPKFMIGMVGTKLGGIKWKGDHPEVILKRTTHSAELGKVLDLGQRQFKKFAETYLGEKAADHLKANDHINLQSGKPPKTLLEMTFETAVRKMLEEMLANLEGM